MKLYTMIGDSIEEGVTIVRQDGPLKVHVSDSFSLGLDTRLTDCAKRAPLFGELKLKYAAISRNEKTLAFSRDNDHLALLVLSLPAPTDGDISISSAAFTEQINPESGNTERLYGTFPSIGVKVLGDVADPPPWFGGEKILQLAIILNKGSAFRITREGDTDMRRIVTLYWNGWMIDDLPRKRTQDVDRKSEPKTPPANEVSVGEVSLN